MPRKKTIKPPVNLKQVLDNAKKIAGGYPEDCRELVKIKKYIKELEGQVEYSRDGNSHC